MAHKTLVGGTAYNITGGKSLVSGTVYDIKGGRTLVSGTGYDIKFSRDPAYAMVYSDNSMVFQRGNEIETGKTLSASYTGFEEEEYTSSPWAAYQNNIINVFFKDEVIPTSMAYWFQNHRSLKNMNVVNLNLAKTTNMSYAFASCNNFVGSPICGINVISMIDTYSRCFNLTGSPVCGTNMVNMHGAYYYCNNLTGSPVCGENVSSMYGTYQECHNLTGKPVCGNKVTNMSLTYYNDYNLTGSPVCGSNVTNMRGTYYYCNKLTGSPVCGTKVINMDHAYAHCSALTGSPVCGSNVTNMYGTYLNCSALTGSPVCGAKVTNMAYAYAYCSALTGSPVCGAKVTSMLYAYYDSAPQNTGKNAYFYSFNITNVKNCFGMKNNSKRLNIYVPANSTTNTTVHYNNTSSLVGANIVWTNAGTYQYNRTYNIYIYPVSNVAANRVSNGD